MAIPVKWPVICSIKCLNYPRNLVLEPCESIISISSHTQSFICRERGTTDAVINCDGSALDDLLLLPLLPLI